MLLSTDHRSRDQVFRGIHQEAAVDLRGLRPLPAASAAQDLQPGAKRWVRGCVGRIWRRRSWRGGPSLPAHRLSAGWELETATQEDAAAFAANLTASQVNLPSVLRTGFKKIK